MRCLLPYGCPLGILCAVTDGLPLMPTILKGSFSSNPTHTSSSTHPSALPLSFQWRAHIVLAKCAFRFVHKSPTRPLLYSLFLLPCTPPPCTLSGPDFVFVKRTVSNILCSRGSCSWTSPFFQGRNKRGSQGTFVLCPSYTPHPLTRV